MKKRRGYLKVWAIGFALLLEGCGNAQHEATEAAINAAQTAINTTRESADKFVPEQMQAAQDALQSAKDALAKGDYAAALNSARNATQKVKEAAAAAALKKDEWMKTWNSLNASAPKTLTEIQIKMEAYKKYGRLPKGVGTDQMESAEAQFEQVKQDWSEAVAAHKGGNFLDAAKKAANFREGLQKLKELLGFQP